MQLYLTFPKFFQFLISLHIPFKSGIPFFFFFLFSFLHLNILIIHEKLLYSTILDIFQMCIIKALRQFQEYLHPFNNEDIPEIFSSPSRLPTTVS